MDGEPKDTNHLGPHMGAGWGGKIRLTGNVDRDRAEVIGALTILLRRARAGEFDDLLTLTEEEREIVRGQLVEP